MHDITLMVEAACQYRLVDVTFMISLAIDYVDTS